MFKKTSQTTDSESGPTEPQESAKPDPFRQGHVREHKRSMLSPSISVSGDISGDEDLVLDGQMEGSISLPKNEVMIGPEGKVKANIKALKVSVEGRLTGDIKSGERVVIRHSGRVEGNIVAPRVVLEDGCQFKGSVEMNIDTESGGSASPERETKNPARETAGREQASKSGPQASKVGQFASQGQGKSQASGSS
jgi:cytoskeletal protein CcmA (bactofilin family)